jgi:hypothetical protein
MQIVRWHARGQHATRTDGADRRVTPRGQSGLRDVRTSEALARELLERKLGNRISATEQGLQEKVRACAAVSASFGMPHRVR